MGPLMSYFFWEPSVYQRVLLWPQVIVHIGVLIQAFDVCALGLMSLSGRVWIWRERFDLALLLARCCLPVL